AGNLVTKDQRHLDAVFQGAVAGDDVMEANAAGVDLDHDVLGTRRRIRHLLDLQHVGAARRMHHHRFHHASFRGLNFNNVTSGVTSSKAASTGMPMRSAAGSSAGLENRRTPQSRRTWTTV